MRSGRVHTYFCEDNVIERRCFSLELCRDRFMSGKEILRHPQRSDGVVEGQT